MYKLPLTIILLFYGTFLFAQNTTYLNSSNKRINNEEKAVTKFEIITHNDSTFSIYKSVFNKRKWRNPEFQSTILKKSESVFHAFANINNRNNYQILEIIDTLAIGYKVKLTNENNVMLYSGEVINLFPLIFHGNCTLFDNDGLPMARMAYNNGEKLNEELLFNPTDSTITITQFPEFPEGQRAFLNEIAFGVRYPVPANYRNIGNDVYVKFTIDEEGKMSQFSEAINSDKVLVKEGIRVVSSINKLWRPATSNGIKIPVLYYAKISFKGAFVIK